MGTVKNNLKMINIHAKIRINFLIKKINTHKLKSAPARDRTTDLKIFSLTLSQLSYKG